MFRSFKQFIISIQTNGYPWAPSIQIKSYFFLWFNNFNELRGKKLKSGYHEIESCFCPISLHDIIEIKESNENKLSLSGIKINTPKKNNIIKKALEFSESQKKYKIHLHKKIPIGGGLGGGSSDAAFLLKFLYSV